MIFWGVLGLAVLALSVVFAVSMQSACLLPVPPDRPRGGYILPKNLR
jgi:hypothetical protein